MTWSSAEYQEDMLLSSVTEQITDLQCEMEVLELSVGSTELTEAASA